MNYKIQELAEQALDHPDLHSYDAKRFHEIFAETIIRECAKVADVADENKCEWIGGNILTYFGVKE